MEDGLGEVFNKELIRIVEAYFSKTVLLLGMENKKQSSNLCEEVLQV